MTEKAATYQIRLYGRVTGDRDVFVHKMSVLLEISYEEMNDVMQNLPSVVKRNIRREKARFIKEQCTRFGGLCLVETMDCEEQASSPDSLQPRALVDRVRDAWREWDADSKARTYFVLLVAATAVLSGIVVVGYSLSVIKIYRGASALAARDAQSRSSDPSPSTYTTNLSDGQDRVDLSLKKEELEDQLMSLRFRFEQASQGLRQVSRSTTVNRRDVFERSREVVELRNKIREVHSTIQQLRDRLELDQHT